MVKLTPAQIDFLRAVKAGKAWRSESIGTLYKTFRDDKPGPVRESVVKALTWTSDGIELIRIGDTREGYRLSRWWVITPDGEKALAEYDKEQKP